MEALAPADFERLVAEFFRERGYELAETPPTRDTGVDLVVRAPEDGQVLLVEVKQFQQGETRVVVPTLWGYTEQARRIKKVVTTQKAGGRRIWNYEEFKRDLNLRLEQRAAESVLNFYEFVRQLEGMQAPRWGTGTLS